MKRYQLYMNPYSISAFDDLGKILGISRSKQLRLVIDRVAEQLLSILRTKKTSQNRKKFLLNELAGFVDIKTNKKTNFIEHIDDVVYFQNGK